MDPSVLEDEKVRAVVCKMAQKLAPPGIDRCDLAGEAYVRILKTRPPQEGIRDIYNFVTHLAFCEMYDFIKDERRRNPASCYIDDVWPAAGDYPEPSDGLVSLLLGLTDLEAQTVVLACGMDGSQPRSPEWAAWMMGANKYNTRKRYNHAVAKLRSAIEHLAGGTISLHD